MKKLLALMVVLLFIVQYGSVWTGAKADYLGPLTTSQYVQCEAFSFDSAGVDPIKPESLFIVTYDPDGDSTWGEIIDTSNANLKGPYTRRIGNGATIIFYNYFRLVSVIDGDQGVGPYQISIIVYEDADETRWITNHYFTLVNSRLDASLDSAAYAQKANAEVVNIDAWNPITDNDSLIIDFSSLSSAIVDINVASVNANALESGDFEDGFLKSSKIEDGAITAAKIAANAIGASEIADAAFDSAAFADGLFRAIKKFIWADTLDGVREAESAEDRILNILAFLDGSVPLDSATFETDYWTAIQNASGSVSIPDSVAARIDSILFKIGAFGFTQSASTPNTILQWLLDLELKVDSTNTSLGYDPSTSAHSKIDNLTLSGGGTEPETLVVMSSSDSTLIEGAAIVVRTLDQSTVKVDGLATDVNGKRILELDPDSFFVALTHNNYTQSLDTIVVPSGGGTDTLWMTDFNPGDPPSADLCRVFGWVYDIAGTPVKNAEISAQITSEYLPVKYSGIVITPFKKTTVTDSTGYWAMDLLPNSLLSNPESEYMVTIEYPSGIIFRTKTAVPDLSSWQLQ